MNDIDLSDGDGNPSEWIPIGQYTDKTPNGYAGSFDGGGFTVSGYIVTSADAVSANSGRGLAAGFFGLVGQSAKIRGLTVSGVVSVDIGNDGIDIHAGGIAGVNKGTITDNANSGGVSASGGKDIYAGGIAGENYGTITNNTHSGGGVSASGGSYVNYAGGIAGYSDSGKITNNANNGGDVSASGGYNNRAGGIAGENFNSTITNNAHSGGDVSASDGSTNHAGGIVGVNNYGPITNCAHSGGTVTASGGSNSDAGGIAGFNSSGKITNCTHSGGTVTASGGSNNSYAGGIAGKNYGTITNNANNGGDVSASGGSNNHAGGIAGYNDTNNKVNISNSCWPVGDLEDIGGGDKGPDAVSTDVVSLDAAEMQMAVTTVLPVERTLPVALGRDASALTSYPGRAEDMTGYFSVNGDISVVSPDIAGISKVWPCAVSGKKIGVTAVSFYIDLRGTDFSDKTNLKPLAASCITDPLCFTVIVGEVPVAEVSLDLTELTLNIGESKKLTATVKPDDATDKAVTWTSNDPAVAAVDENGKVTALSVGTTAVTAKAGGVSATCKVTVAQPKRGGSSHGCAAGLGALSMLTLIPLWRRRKR